MDRLGIYLEKSAANARTTVRATGSTGMKKIPPHLLTLALALPAGYGMYRALDDLLKKRRD